MNLVSTPTIFFIFALFQYSTPKDICERDRRRKRRLARMALRDGDLEGISVWTDAQKQRMKIAGGLPLYHSDLNRHLFLVDGGSSENSGFTAESDPRSKRSGHSLFGNWARRHDPQKQARLPGFSRKSNSSSCGKHSSSPTISDFKGPITYPPALYGRQHESHLAQPLYGTINPGMDFGYYARSSGKESGDVEYWGPPLQTRNANALSLPRPDPVFEMYYENLPEDSHFPQADGAEYPYRYYSQNPSNQHAGSANSQDSKPKYLGSSYSRFNHEEYYK